MGRGAVAELRRQEFVSGMEAVRRHCYKYVNTSAVGKAETIAALGGEEEPIF